MESFKINMDESLEAETQTNIEGGNNSELLEDFR